MSSSDDDAGLPSTSRHKRRRLDGTQGSYARGAVMRITAHNFMTYEHVTVEPGPSLNLILGPNGTGKSSLVCALCIGLAGSPKILSRADSVKDFVRRGQMEGWVEITLSDGKGARGPRTVRIKRLIKTDNSSRWYINGSEATMTAVREKVSSFNVQLDNLCQFLPQDRVAAFASLRPHELLLETEKAIGNAQLYEQHMDMVQLKTSVQEKQAALAATNALLVREEAATQMMEREVQRAQQREELLQKLNVVTNKIKYTEWTSADTKLQKLTTEHEACAQLLDTKKKQLDEEHRPYRKMEDRETRALQAAERARSAYRSMSQGTTSSVQLFNALKQKLDALEKAKRNLDNLEMDDLEHRVAVARLRKVAQQCANAMYELAPLRPTLNEELATARAKVGELSAKLSTSLSEINFATTDVQRIGEQRQAVQAQLQQLSDVKLQRLQALSHQNAGIMEQYKWVQERVNVPKSGFHAPVLGPIALEIDVKNMQHAAMLEQNVSRTCWGMFVVQHPDDQQRLIRKMQQEIKQKPAVTCIVPEDAAQPISHPGGPASSLATWGIAHTLDEVFDALPPIKHTLCNEGNLHRAYVGTEATEGRMQELLDAHPRLGTIYTPSERHITRTSYYNNTISVSSERTWRRPQILLGDLKGIEVTRARLQEQLDALNNNVAEMEARKEELLKVQARLNEEQAAAKHVLNALTEGQRQFIEQKRRAEGKLTVARNQLRTREQQPRPIDKRDQLEADLVRCRAKVIQAVDKLTEANDQEIDVLIEYMQCHLKSKECVAQLKEVSVRSVELQTSIRDLGRALARIQAELTREEKRRREFAEGQSITEEQIQAFASLPDSLTELRAEAATLKAQADNILVSSGVLQQYRERQVQIQELRGQQEAQTLALETAQREMDELKQQWLPELQRRVGMISSSFGESFKRVGCAGEVVLITPDDDVNKFAIEIKVKFREEEALHALTASRQSGGERSLSTILYLISLQGVTKVPFRVVDEINQGMDAINERKAFEQLVESATNEDTPQCFLLTPKLLPNLTYSPNVTVLQIMNGPFVDEVANNFSMDMILGAQAVEASA